MNDATEGPKPAPGPATTGGESAGLRRRRVLMVVEDLFFATRITSTAQLLGVEVEPSPVAQGLVRCRATTPDLVILDLHAPGDPLGLARALKADEAVRAISIVGFYSHVDQELRERAITAGVDRVMPRSAFTAKLAEVLGGPASPLRSGPP